MTSLKVEVWQEGWTAINSTGQWVEIDSEMEKNLVQQVRNFIEAMQSLAIATEAPGGAQMVFWLDKGEITTKSWASAGANLYRLTCIGTPPSGTV